LQVLRSLYGAPRKVHSPQIPAPVLRYVLQAYAHTATANLHQAHRAKYFAARYTLVSKVFFCVVKRNVKVVNRDTYRSIAGAAYHLPPADWRWLYNIVDIPASVYPCF